MGRRKISIKQIADPKLRHITFNKRRNGLIKKAAELSLLCNVNMLLIFEDGNGNLIQFSRNKITTIPSFFKECTYSSVSEFTAKDYPNFFKVNHYKKHKDEDGNEELQEEMAAEQEEMPSAFEDPALPAPQIKILNKRDTFSNAHHSTDDGYMSDHMVYYSGSEESVHEGNDGVRTFPETPMREPYYNQPKPSQYAMAKLRAPRSEENQKPILYEAEISRPYPEEQETSPIHREREPREPREARESRELCQNYREMPPRGPIVDDKPMDYAQPYPHERPDRPMKRPSYSENGPYPYRYYPGPHMPPYYDYPPHAYPYPYGYPYPPYGYPTKHRPRAYREVMPGDEAVNSMFKYSSRGFGMEPEPYLGKQSSKPEMDDRITNTANMVKYLNNSGTNTYAGQKIYNFYSSENGKPEEEPQPQPQPQPQVNYPKTNRAVDFEGVPYDVEPEYQEINPYHRGPDHRYENSNTTNGTIPTNLPAAYFSSRKFNFEGYPNSFEDDRFNEFSDPKKKLKQ